MDWHLKLRRNGDLDQDERLPTQADTMKCHTGYSETKINLGVFLFDRQYNMEALISEQLATEIFVSK